MAKRESAVKSSDITDITFETMAEVRKGQEYNYYFGANCKGKPIHINYWVNFTSEESHEYKIMISDDGKNYAEPKWATPATSYAIMRTLLGKLSLLDSMKIIDDAATVEELCKAETEIINHTSCLSADSAEPVWGRYSQKMDYLVAKEFSPRSISIPRYEDMSEQGIKTIKDMHMPAFWMADSDGKLNIMKKGVFCESTDANYICPILQVDKSLDVRSSFMFKGRWWTTIQPGITICEDGIGYDKAENSGLTPYSLLEDWAKQNMPEIPVIRLLGEAPIQSNISPEVTEVAALTTEEAIDAEANVPGILTLPDKNFWTRDEEPHRPAQAYCMCKSHFSSLGMRCTQCDMDVEAGVRPVLRIANMNELGLFPGDKIKYQGYTWTAISSKQLLCDSIVAQSKYLDVRFDENKREFVKSDGTTVPKSSLTYRFSDLAAAIDGFVKDAQIPIIPAAPPEMEHLPVYEEGDER